MKNEFLIFLGSISLVLLTAFILVNLQNSLTGYTILNESSENDIEVTREQVIESLSNCEDIIEDMKFNNFSTIYMDDTLIEANKILIQVDYAEILRGNTENKTLIKEAENALQLIYWYNLTYSSVLDYTLEIENRKIQAFEIYDSFTLFENELNNYASKGIDTTIAFTLLDQSKVYFYQDRYSDAENTLEQAQNYVESQSSELSISKELQRSAKGFIINNWHYILLVVIILGLIGFFTQKTIRYKLLKRKILKLKTENIVLFDLIKKTQTERFKENSISGLTYHIRMKKYKEKIEQIKRDLPVLESKLHKSSKRPKNTP